ncbi:MAG: HXXEE domain-containing protein [Candidatus Zixiibacteriota bacterium]|nr:MAG: HXXEE domain-containing protein [candidate division Zixibacteria bacterium]
MADLSVGRSKLLLAWVVMIAMIAVHVLDEMISDFLPFYNQLVLDLREKVGFFPAPTFSFWMWMGGLIGGIVICFALTPLVARGSKFIRIFTTALGVIMIFNALLHIGMSVYYGQLVPGFWSSPFLLVAAVLVVVWGVRGRGGPADSAI